VLGGDTGLAHLAVAMGQRVVMIMHATGVEHTCPYQHLDWVVSPPSGQSADLVPTEAVQLTCTRVLGVSI
jgi:ADP-heptose:LPS heptosyltransferase